MMWPWFGPPTWFYKELARITAQHEKRMNEIDASNAEFRAKTKGMLQGTKPIERTDSMNTSAEFQREPNQDLVREGSKCMFYGKPASEMSKEELLELLGYVSLREEILVGTARRHLNDSDNRIQDLLRGGA